MINREYDTLISMVYPTNYSCSIWGNKLVIQRAARDKNRFDSVYLPFYINGAKLIIEAELPYV